MPQSCCRSAVPPRPFPASLVGQVPAAIRSRFASPSSPPRSLLFTRSVLFFRFLPVAFAVVQGGPSSMGCGEGTSVAERHKPRSGEDDAMSPRRAKPILGQSKRDLLTRSPASSAGRSSSNSSSARTFRDHLYLSHSKQSPKRGPRLPSTSKEVLYPTDVVKGVVCALAPLSDERINKIAHPWHRPPAGKTFRTKPIRCTAPIPDAAASASQLNITSSLPPL